MNLIEQVASACKQHISKLFGLDEQQVKAISFDLNVDETKQAFGDVTTNAALVLAKQLGKQPRAIAQEIVDSFTHEHVQKIEIAGPGFINMFLTTQAFALLAHQLFEQGQAFFVPDSQYQKRTISLEFVSANPTGPLHFGHGRGGIIGDVLGNILRFLGHTVTQEYYINDAGRQIKKLGESFKARCQQVAGQDAQVPEDGYHGQYLLDLAKECYAQHGNNLLEQPDEFFTDYAKDKLLERIKHTLERYGITFDVWFSEQKELHDKNLIEKALQLLEQKNYLYKKDDALWFTSTKFDDDKDRVVRRANGEFTYIAADFAYMKNKIDRGHNQLILIIGYDHHGFVPRLKAAHTALDLDAYPFDVLLYQLVKIKVSNELVRMSKRAGRIITLDDVISTVGTDVARFFYLNRKADAHLEFDLDLALKKTQENPVYYVQYAYVRTKSILQKSAQEKQLADINAADAQGIGTQEALLIKKIIALKDMLQVIGTNYQTHTLTYYVLELATIFHAYYSKARVIDLDNIAQSRSRLLLIMTLSNTFATVLKLLGISRPEKM